MSPLIVDPLYSFLGIVTTLSVHMFAAVCLALFVQTVMHRAGDTLLWLTRPHLLSTGRALGHLLAWLRCLDCLHLVEQ